MSWLPVFYSWLFCPNNGVIYHELTSQNYIPWRDYEVFDFGLDQWHKWPKHMYLLLFSKSVNIDGWLGLYASHCTEDGRCQNGWEEVFQSTASLGGNLADRSAVVSSLRGVHYHYWASYPLLLCKQVEKSLRICLLFPFSASGSLHFLFFKNKPSREDIYTWVVSLWWQSVHWGSVERELS